jgi:ribosomal protein S27AE
MSNFVPPPFEFDTWKCPKCGQAVAEPRSQSPMQNPASLFRSKKKPKCPKCGTLMVRK